MYEKRYGGRNSENIIDQARVEVPDPTPGGATASVGDLDPALRLER